MVASCTLFTLPLLAIFLFKGIIMGGIRHEKEIENPRRHIFKCGTINGNLSMPGSDPMKYN